MAFDSEAAADPFCRGDIEILEGMMDGPKCPTCTMEDPRGFEFRCLATVYGVAPRDLSYHVPEIPPIVVNRQDGSQHVFRYIEIARPQSPQPPESCD